MVISDVHFINVTGTASKKAGNVVASLACSSACDGFTSSGTSLKTANGTAPVYDCANITNATMGLDFTCTQVKA